MAEQRDAAATGMTDVEQSVRGSPRGMKSVLTRSG
jgi:hypothetical protein